MFLKLGVFLERKSRNQGQILSKDLFFVFTLNWDKILSHIGKVVENQDLGKRHKIWQYCIVHDFFGWYAYDDDCRDNVEHNCFNLFLL